MKRISILLAGVMAIILIPCMGSFPVDADDFPTRPVTVIVPVSPGGTTDSTTRAYGSVAEKLLAQPVVVVNKAGAAGMIGASACAEAPPDGYTMVVIGTHTWVTVEWENANNRKPMVTRNDFTDIGGLYQDDQVIVVRYESPWKTLSDLINTAKTKPGHYAYSSYGMYGFAHLNVELFARTTGLKFRHVPSTGGAAAVSAVLGNHVDFSVASLGSAFPLLRANKLRALAVLSAKRNKHIPDVPTAREQGVDVEGTGIMGLSVPRKTPAPVVKKLREIHTKAIADKAFISVVENIGSEVPPFIGEELTTIFENQSEKFAKLLKQLIAEEKK